MADNPTKTPRSKKAKAIEAEYGMSFWSVVKGFADDNESIRSTASIIGYSRNGLLELIKRHKMRHLFKGTGHQSNTSRAYYDRVKTSKTMSEKELIASRSNLKKAQRLRKNQVAFVFNGISDSMRGHSLRCGIPIGTSYQRLCAGYSPEIAFNPDIDLNQTRNSKDHPWAVASRKGFAQWQLENEAPQCKNAGA